MPSYYTYGEMPDAEETVYGPLDFYREGIMPTDESVPFYDFPIPDERETIQPTDEVEPVYTPEVQGGLETIQPTDEDVPIPDSAAQSGRETTQPTYEQAPVTPPPPTPVSQPPAPVAPPPAPAYFDSGLATSGTPSGIDKTASVYTLFSTIGKTPSLGAPTDVTKPDPFGILSKAQAGTGGSDLAQGNLYDQLRAAEAQKIQSALEQYASQNEVTPEIAGALAQVQKSQQEDLAAREEVYKETLPQRQVLSNLLKSNDFSSAFDYAKKNGLEELLGNPEELKNLRQPFTRQEAQQFMAALPRDFIQRQTGLDDEKFKQAFDFDPATAGERNAYAWVDPSGKPSDTGFPSLGSAYIPKADKPGDFDIMKAIAIGSALFGIGSLISGALSAAGGAGAAGAGGAGGLSSIGSTIKSVYQTIAAIPGQIGGTVAGALNLPINSALAQAAFGNSLISAATTAAKGGDIGDILKAGLLAAGVTYGLDAAVNAIKGMMPEVSQSVSGEVAKAAANTGVSSSTAFDALQEIVVTGRRLSDVAGLGGAVAGVTRGLGEPSAEPKPEDLQEVTVTGTRVPVAGGPVGALVTPKPETKPEVKAPLSEEAPPEDLEEVTVTAKKPEVPPVVVSPPPPAPPSPIETVPPEPVEPLEEVTVTAKRPEVPPVVVTPPPSPPRGLDVFEPEPVEDLEEVTVTGRRIEQPPVVVSPPPAVKTGPIDVAAPEAPIEEFTVTGSRGELDFTEPPAIVVKTPDIAKDYKPTEVVDSDKSTLEKLLEKYGTLENLLKLLGIFGGVTSDSGRVSTGGTMPSLGGALPVYDIKRTQLRPNIDYYTYGTRPEVKFFDYGDQVFVPVIEPPPADVNPPDENRPMAHGGLTGYAHGGSKSSRYVEGPGSGRDDKIPALLSDGEYVIDAETLALLGDGSTKEGAKRLDEFRANIRRHKGQALSRGQISPNAKSPEKYMGGGLT